MLLRISTSLYNKLHAMNSPVAKYLIGDNEFTSYCNFLSFRIEDGKVLFSFIPEGKIQLFTDSGSWSKKDRQTGKPAKIARKLINSSKFTDEDYEEFHNELNGISQQIEYRVSDKLDDFEFAYHYKNYYEITGSLGSSCMRYDECQNYLKFYNELGNVSILIATKENKVVGRALVWTLSKGILLDRIYGIDDSIQYGILKYAKEALCIDMYKTYNTYDTPQSITMAHSEERRYLSLSFRCNIDPEDFKVPYLDTFKYFQDGWMLNEEPGNNCRYLEMTNCDGSVDEHNYTFCCQCGCHVEDDNCIMIHDEYYCNDCAVYDSINGCYILREDSITYYDGYNDRYTHESEVEYDTIIWVEEVAKYVYSNLTVYDDINECYILRENSICYGCDCCTHDDEIGRTIEWDKENRQYELLKDLVLIDDDYYRYDSELIEYIDGEYRLKNE